MQQTLGNSVSTAVMMYLPSDYTCTSTTTTTTTSTTTTTTTATTTTTTTMNGQIFVDGPYGDDSASGITIWTDEDMFKAHGHITAIQIRAGAWIDSIQARYGDTWGTVHGGSSGTLYVFYLNSGSSINRVEGNADGEVDILTFYSDDGSTYGPYGGAGQWASPGVAFNSDRQGCKLAFISGANGGYLNALSLHYECKNLAYDNCYDVYLQNSTLPGVYNMSDGTAVKCIEEGGTVIQHRGQYGNAEDYFAKTWAEYVEGFGTPENELWLGLDKIHELTSNATNPMTLYISMEAFDGTLREANYYNFSIEDGTDNYRLRVSGYSGTAGDVFIDGSGRNGWIANGVQFSTYDNDNDLSSSSNCADSYSDGGWWFNNCVGANLNGINYDDGVANSSWTGILWYHSDWSEDSTRSLKTTTMAIFPQNTTRTVTITSCTQNSDCAGNTNGLTVCNPGTSLCSDDRGCDDGSGGWECCTPSNPCGIGEGDCDYDSDCSGSLICGHDSACNHGYAYYDSSWDCCIEEYSSTSESP